MKKKVKKKGKTGGNNTHPGNYCPGNSPNMANGSYRKELMANISGWGDESLAVECLLALGLDTHWRQQENDHSRNRRATLW